MQQPPAAAPGGDSDLQPGFRHLVLDAQRSFRAALQALSRPGLVVSAPVELDAPAPLAPATAALALTLFDADTPVWLDAGSDTRALRAYLRFHCGCPLTDTPASASFAVVSDAARLPALHGFDIGDECYPDRACTVLLQLPALEGGPPARLSGPGVDGHVDLAPAGLPVDFAARWAANRGLFPQGVDVFLCSGTRFIGLPRSVDWHPGA